MLDSMFRVIKMALDNSDMSLTRKAVKAELLDAETELQLAYAWRL